METKDFKDRVIEQLLSTIAYDEMTQKQEKLVVEYETEIWKNKVEELKNKGISKKEIEEQIHDWWLDYQFADGTENNLLKYIEQ